MKFRIHVLREISNGKTKNILYYNSTITFSYSIYTKLPNNVPQPGSIVWIVYGERWSNLKIHSIKKRGRKKKVKYGCCIYKKKKSKSFENIKYKKSSKTAWVTLWQLQLLVLRTKYQKKKQIIITEKKKKKWLMNLKRALINLKNENGMHRKEDYGMIIAAK